MAGEVDFKVERMAKDMAKDSFLGPEDLERLVRLQPDEMDALPHGAVALDGDERVLVYNAFESDLSGIEKEAALGRHFFRELAPCANNGLYRGLLRRNPGPLDHLLPYTYSVRMRPTHVMVHLYREAEGEPTWLFTRRAGQ